MKKPSAFAYLIGNPVSFFTLAILTLLLGAIAIAGSSGLWVVVIPTLSLTLWANQAQEQIQKYRLWKIEWEGLAEAPAKRSRAASGGKAKIIVGAIAWSVLALMALATHGAGAAIFFAASVVLGIVLLVRRSARKSAAKASTAPQIVSICLPAARSSTTLAQAYANLPAHCLSALDPP